MSKPEQSAKPTGHSQQRRDALAGAVLFALLAAGLWFIPYRGIKDAVMRKVDHYTCLVHQKLEKPPKLSLSTLESTYLDLYESPVAAISPIALNEQFEFGGNGTDLQRKNLLQQISGKVVQWKLMVYDVKQVNATTARISTKHGSVDKRTEQQKFWQDLGNMASVLTMGEKVYGTQYVNQNIGTDIDLTVRSQADWDTLGRLKTGDWIQVRAKIADVSFRRVDLKPAMLEDGTNTTGLKAARAKLAQHEQALTAYRNRSCPE